jgi:hypothetical protein
MKALAILLLSALPCVAGIDQARLADAIWIAEGGNAAKSPYGILDGKQHDPAEARSICIRTIRHAARGWRGSDRGFIQHLSDKYCPPSVDLQGNRNWRRNVSWLYFRGLVRH